jgi:adenylate cyclase
MLFVIARDSSFLYKGQSRDIGEVAKHLQVRYILSGSVRRAGERLRLNAQLTDTRTGSSLWAEHYDGTLADVFGLQDQISRQIVAALSRTLGTGGGLSPMRRDTASPEAYDAFLHGRNRFFLYANKEENRKARDLYQKAIELDPGFGTAYAMLAWTHAFDAMNGWSDSRGDSLDKAEALAAQAVALDEALPVAYFVTGLVYRERGEYEKAVAEARKAIALDPSYANAHVLLATLLYFTGRPQDGLELIQRAMRLNPHYPYNYPFHLGQAYYILSRYPQAIEAYERGLQSNPNSERLRVWLAAAYAQAGRVEDATWEAEQVLAVNPDFSVSRISEAFPFKDPADLEHFLDGLHKAGLSQ